MDSPVEPEPARPTLSQLLSLKISPTTFQNYIKFADLQTLRLYDCEKNNHPTNLFTILEHQNQSRDVSELHKMSRSPDLEALKL